MFLVGQFELHKAHSVLVNDQNPPNKAEYLGDISIYHWWGLMVRPVLGRVIFTIEQRVVKKVDLRS